MTIGDGSAPPEKTVRKAEGDPKGHQVTGAHVLAGDHSAAKDYGKGKVGKHFPSSDDLLGQIKEDEAKKVHTFGQDSFAKEREIAKNLKPEDLKNIGAIVDAIERPGNHASLGAALKAYEHNPKGLDNLKDMIQLEMERRKLPNGQTLADKYDVDLRPFDDRKNSNPTKPEEMNRRALVVSRKHGHHGTVGYSTTGAKVPESLLREFYD